MVSEDKVSALRLGLFRLARLLRRQNLDLSFSQTEFNILGLLGRRKNLLPSEIAQEEKISAQAISQNLNTMERAGLISRQTDPGDRRKTVISLSKTGLEILDKVKHERDIWLLRAMEQKLTAEEREQLLAVAPLLHKLTTEE
ncbi:MarR family winged helix-turn-helix transcriptional regulator [Pedobacter sp. SYP-B3415]|uniref:MarR family winged helix-turn-helix transcriptional regulator n=1 Tax=Pedobacter sp. SYP-B3415 TaxID=2496641 RepID=UPI00101CEA51|nr:MarR family transcriptional regulator [Pedobacter sp. SYP-B3415]